VTYGTTKVRAEKLAERANHMIKDGWRPSNLERDRVIDRVEVRGFSWNPNHHSTLSPSIKTWGLNPRWAYADRPDLGVDFGGPFIPLRDVI
jgi:hypothetical protein